MDDDPLAAAKGLIFGTMIGLAILAMCIGLYFFVKAVFI